ncbi:hypothetical protein CP10139811_0877 [Chlamydia ibidis]|uniref:Uncharacterized protein n=2 Tax=Chlamydia ibidis TaxID=1405396 RepID=S7J2S6_9CHLA|nr:hypothetical protein [Chlamydia ibidis]EPP34548.1 hypothetical protein CP10139811_0877 [Chlamydia ibidis]EQM63016.1 hypothetical protein H359_0196 [Chlamydia ibidis 10-1398/6]
MRRLLSAIKLHLSSLWSSNPSPLLPNSYDNYSRSMLLLLCRLKDADLVEWQYACNTLSEVCSRMSNTILLDKPSASSSKDALTDWENKYLELKKDYLFRDEQRQQQIEKLQNENSWLQNRLAEKLQQARHQNDIIDELKRDLVESIQQTEISEGRRLCYEHKIKVLEEQIDKLTTKFSESEIY